MIGSASPTAMYAMPATLVRQRRPAAQSATSAKNGRKYSDTGRVSAESPRSTPLRRNSHGDHRRIATMNSHTLSVSSSVNSGSLAKCMA
jgi:hypothetical protein